jgi:TetR/AcrR family transcriptional regulator, transcriptional repressor for nem operon
MPRPDNGTRQKLIDTAKDLIWTSSYGAVSVDDICKAAGVKKGSFYHYFPSKQDLAIVALEEYQDYKLNVILGPIFNSDRTFSEKIDALANAILEDSRKYRDRLGIVCGCPIAAMGSEMISPEEQVIHDKVLGMFEMTKGIMHAELRRAVEGKAIAPVDPEEKTAEMHDFITGLMIMARINNSLDGLERDLKGGMRRIMGLDVHDKTYETELA